MILIAFVDDDLRDGVPLLGLLTRGVMKMVEGYDNGTWRGKMTMELGEGSHHESSLIHPSALCRQKNVDNSLVTFLCCLYHGVLPFLALPARRAMKVMVLCIITAVAMGCFTDSSASLLSQWSHHCLILTPPQSYRESKYIGNTVHVMPLNGCQNSRNCDNDGKKLTNHGMLGGKH